MSKTNENSHHPYAKLFEYVFQKSEMVQDFMENFFPQSLLDSLDVSSLHSESVSYLSPELSRLYSDVVYTCDYGDSKDKVIVTLLFEHKSYYSKNPHLQLLSYMLKIWEQQRDNSEPITPVIPIILYHGEQKWKARGFTDMFAGKIGEDLKPFIPNFDLYLIDLNVESDEKLKGLKKRFLTNSLLALKYHKNKAYIRRHFSFLVEVENDIYRQTMLVFLIKNYDITKEEVPKLLAATSKQSKSKIMNAIEAYFTEGEKKGLHNKNVQAVKNMMAMDLSVSVIVKALDVTEKFVKDVIEGKITEIA